MRQMKDSGIEWIGKIPENWSVERNKQLFYEVNDRCENGDEHTLLSVSEYFGIAPKSEKISDGEFETRAETLDGYKLCEIDDIVMNIMLAWKRATGRSDYNGIVSPAYCVYRKKADIDTHYYHYLFRTDIVANLFKQYSTGIIDSRLRLYPDKFLALQMPFPPLPEQQAISAHLDRQCAHIDNIIEKTKASIEEYKKLRQAVITQAVTKGVRGDRPMKDSGIGWIGEIPEEWSLGKAKYYITITNGSDPITEGDIPVYGSGAKSFKTCGEYKEPPCVLIGRKGATLHIPHFIEHKYWNVDTAFDVKPKKGMLLRYYYFLACVFDYKYYISQTTLPGMTQTNYENMVLPIPTCNEQEEILSYLDSKLTEIDSLISKKEQFLNELESYKKSMIYEYVTGKKEVPQS